MDDLEVEMLTALVEKMRRTGLSHSGVCGRLVYAARKAGQRHRYTIQCSRRRKQQWKQERAEPPEAGARAGKRLPTEAEWEYAARGGLEQVQVTYKVR